MAQANEKIELIYSRQKTDFLPGRAYSNPRFFTTTRSNVSKVYVVGDWPKIHAAYGAIGIPVVRLDAPPTEPPPPSAVARAPKTIVPAAPVDERGTITIPEDWRDLSWSRPDPTTGLTLRGLAAQFSDQPVINKAIATAAVEAELARRGTSGETPSTQDTAEAEIDRLKAEESAGA